MALNGKGRRVAVTGLGVVTCIGTGVETFWNAIKSGTHGIGPIENFPLQDLYIKIAGEVPAVGPRNALQEWRARRCYCRLGRRGALDPRKSL